VALDAEDLPPLQSLPPESGEARRLLMNVLRTSLRAMTAAIESAQSWLEARLTLIIPRIIAVLEKISVQSPFLKLAWNLARTSQVTHAAVGVFAVVVCTMIAAFFCRVLNAASYASVQWSRAADRLIANIG